MLTSVVEGVSQALGSAVHASSFASLEETEGFQRAFREGYRACAEPGNLSYRHYFDLASDKQVFTMTSCFASSVNDDRVWLLLTHHADYCGAVALRPSVLFANARSVISFDKDSICAISQDLQQGCLLDYTPDDARQAFELTAWGDRWPLLLLNCDPKNSNVQHA